jgi:hypothetical protein
MEEIMTSFWNHHGLIFLFFMFFFPRLTMLFTGICFAWSGFLFWLGWIFAPRLTVAILATNVYWVSNPILCVITWMWALSGEVFEKHGGTYVFRFGVSKAKLMRIREF